MRENPVKERVKKILKSTTAFWFMPATGGFGKSGLPDFVGVYEGKFFALECKGNGTRRLPLQIICGQDIQAAGGNWRLVTPDTTQEELVAWMENLK